jgi:hypothetical protein
MTKQRTIESSDLNSQFESLLREQKAACRAAALAALDRVFPADICTSAGASRPGKKGKKGKRKSSGRRNRTVGDSTVPRRSHAEMVELGERLFKAICAKPGQPKTVLAGELDLSTGELDRPMNYLRSSGKVRAVGQRHLTRYFPAIVDAAEQQQNQAGRHAATLVSNSDGQAASVR